MELLFSYGTLQYEIVQKKTYGRKLNGVKDLLSGFILEQVEITNNEVLSKSNKRYHPIAIQSSNAKDSIKGVVFEITPEELKATDAYEVSNYKRVKAKLKSGKSCWVYIENK